MTDVKEFYTLEEMKNLLGVSADEIVDSVTTQDIGITYNTDYRWAVADDNASYTLIFNKECVNVLRKFFGLTEEEIQKNTFVSFITGMGYERERVEDLYPKMQKLMKQFDVPFEKMLACVIYSLSNHCGVEKPLKEIYGIDIEALTNLLPVLEEAKTECGKLLVRTFLNTIADSIREYTKDK